MSSTAHPASEPEAVHGGSSHPAIGVSIGVLAAAILIAAAFVTLRGEPTTGRVVGAILLAIAALGIVPFQFLDARRRRFELTGRALIYHHGVLNRVEIELPYTSVRAVSLRQGLIQRLFGCGDVQVSTEASIPNTGVVVSSADAGTIVLRSIRRPREVALVLRNLMHDS